MTEKIIKVGETTRLFCKRGEIYWINFSHTIGTEIKKIRPALVIFSSEKRVVSLPITSNIRKTPDWQLVIKGLIKGRDGKILFDQIRSFDKQRLFRKIGEINNEEMEQINQMLKKMFLIK
ncbi:plasmid maintenance toxin/Cell growth inhibitor [Glomus cerebriforme]|uniref:Plasmid maintenance toxin/Cell growth inhibitor n=1 Tax=Glomus cerebriforme TaxID=658196 RepID=A0A397TEJ8_9GLOM|nr:plasmid maintenance toxin/Cell growth inhibitor [Glomus cerebriforme]